MPVHSLDKQATRNELLRRGWKVEMGTWVRPVGISNAQAESDWTEATICGIQCEHEDRRAATAKQRENAKKKREARNDISGQ